MPGCAAINCSRHSRNRIRMFSFPRSPRKRTKWVLNMRRDKWKPREHSRLCEVHFEDNQWEENIANVNPDQPQAQRRKLKRTAEPTLFDIPNPPKRLKTADVHRPRPMPRKRPNEETVAENSLASQSWVEHNYFSKRCRSTPELAAEQQTGGEEEVLTNHELAPNPDAHVLTDTDVLATRDAEDPAAPESVVDAFHEERQRLQRQIWRLNKQVQKTKKDLRTLKQEVENGFSFLSKEHRAILLKGKRVAQWSVDLIKDALQIRFAVGWKGYKFLRKKGYPLPSYSTICRKLNAIHFEPGALKEILLFLQLKSASCTKRERDCVLLMDEMEISKGLELYPTMKHYVGNCTLGPPPTQLQQGSQLLVVMLRGLSTNWQQVVGYHILGKENKGNSLTNFVREMLVSSTAAGFNVCGMVTDMGPKNQGVWRDLGIYAGKHCVDFTAKHPCDEDAKLHIFADVPHLLKNMKQMLLNHDIVIPDDVVEKEKLPCNTVTVKYLKHVVDNESRNALKLSKLTLAHIQPNQAQKMKVSMAAQVFSVQTASAIETLVKTGRMSRKALTTAWFLRTVREWFDILNIRVKKDAITRKYRSKTFKKLRAIIALFHKIKFGTEGRWKPVQTGIILTTENAIALVKKLFADGCGYVLTSRFNQDALENLFSILRRHGNSHPSALQALQALKLITVSQFVEDGNTSKNYNDDGGVHYIDIFTKKPQLADTSPDDIEKCCTKGYSMINSDSDTAAEHISTRLSLEEDNSLNNLLGNAVHSIIKKGGVCESCKKLVCQEQNCHREEETLIECRTKGGLTYPTETLFNVAKRAEGIIRHHLRRCQTHPHLFFHITKKIEMKIDTTSINICQCQVGKKVINQFVRLRLHVDSRNVKEDARKKRKRQMGSTSAFKATSITFHPSTSQRVWESSSDED